MAGVKYIKKTQNENVPPVEEPTTTGKRTARGKAAAEPAKPTANSKAKVTKKPAVNGPAAKKAAAPAPKKTGKAATPASTPAKGKGNAAAKKSAKTKTETDDVPAEEIKVSRKRKASSEEAVAAPAKKARVIKKGSIVNQAPTDRLNIYVFGEGSSGELGLGTKKNAIDVKRPRLNANLPAGTVGVVQIAAGGMHVAALTHDNKILTWGVNDQGALGRDTKWDGGLKDMDDNASDDSEDDDDAGLNPKESTPTAIPSDAFPENAAFVQVAAGDSTTFALTDDGQVWGWGTFRVGQVTTNMSIH